MNDEFKDIRELKPSTRYYLLKIKHLIRECEHYNIDYDSYIPKKDLKEIIEILECCLEHKDSKYIERVK